MEVLYGFIWFYMVLYGFIWEISTRNGGFIWFYMVLYGKYPLEWMFYMGIYGKIMGIYGDTRPGYVKQKANWKMAH